MDRSQPSAVVTRMVWCVVPIVIVALAGTASTVGAPIAAAMPQSSPHAAGMTVQSILHCPPNSPTHIYARAGRSLSSATSEGIRGNIQMTAGNMCASGVSHSVTVCNTGSCGGWVQVGWRYYSTYTAPRAYCERKGTSGTYQLTEYSVTNATHAYKWESREFEEKGTLHRQWECSVDGAVKAFAPTTTYGFSKGSWMPVQGEAHSAHVQIGKMAPNKLSFSSLNYKAGTSWPVLSPSSPSAPAPYGADVPNSSTVRVWTNPH